MNTSEERIMHHVPGVQIGMKMDGVLSLVADHLDELEKQNEELKQKLEKVKRHLKWISTPLVLNFETKKDYVDDVLVRIDKARQALKEIGEYD
jgi:chlorite dismutase